MKDARGQRVIFGDRVWILAKVTFDGGDHEGALSSVEMIAHNGAVVYGQQVSVSAQHIYKCPEPEPPKP